MNLLLTGATGYLGSHLASALSDAGHQLIILKRSTSTLERIQHLKNISDFYDNDQTAPAKIFDNHRIDGVIHTAACYGRKGETPSQLLRDNTQFPLELLEASLGRARFFVDTGTSLPWRTSEYALTKKHFRNWLRFFSDQICACEIILEHFYGPGDDPSKFLTRIFHDLLSQVPSIALTSGEQARDFIYIDDVVSGILTLVAALENCTSGFREIPLGSGKTIKIRELVTQIAQIAGNTTTRLDFGALAYRKFEVMMSKADVVTMRQLGWEPRVSLAQGLAQTLAFERERWPVKSGQTPRESA